MARFLVRIELHGAKRRSEYDELHQAMEDKGFIRTAVSGGIEYHLPDGEYLIEGKNSSEVMTAAKTAATATWKKFGIVVTKADAVKIFGLLKVEE